MACHTCHQEHKILKDIDDTRYRKPCLCEVNQPCADCKRGKITHVVLAGDGSISRFVCSKHGLEEAAGWEPLGAPVPKDPVKPKPDAKKLVAEPFKGESTSVPLYHVEKPCLLHASAGSDKDVLQCLDCQGASELKGVIQTHVSVGPAGRSVVVMFVVPEAMKLSTFKITL